MRNIKKTVTTIHSAKTWHYAQGKRHKKCIFQTLVDIEDNNDYLSFNKFMSVFLQPFSKSLVIRNSYPFLFVVQYNVKVKTLNYSALSFSVSQCLCTLECSQRVGTEKATTWWFGQNCWESQGVANQTTDSC